MTVLFVVAKKKPTNLENKVNVQHKVECLKNNIMSLHAIISSH